MSNNRMSTGTILVAIISLILIVLLIHVCIHELDNRYTFHPENYRIASYYVSPGESLWSIGSKYKQDSDDVRVWIQAVKKLNGDHTSLIRADEIIKIYIAKEK